MHLSRCFLARVPRIVILSNHQPRPSRRRVLARPRRTNTSNKALSDSFGNGGGIYAPEGFSCDSVGRLLPTMRAVQDAVQPAVSPTYPLTGVSAGGREANAEGLGHHVGLGPPAVILHRRGSLGEGGVIRYLGRILSQDDDNIKAVRSQIKKAWGIWAQVGQVLQADNTPPKVSAKFYKAVV